MGAVVTFLYRKPGLMHPILAHKRHSSDSSMPKVIPSHVGCLFISSDNLMNRGNAVISAESFD